MLHRLHFPRRPVSEFVEHMWLVRGTVPTAQRQMLLPDGAVVMLINLGDPQNLCERADVRRYSTFRESWISGQQPLPIVIEQVGFYHLIGIRFRPAGAYPLFRFSLSELTGRVVELEEIWGARIRQIRQQLGEKNNDKTLFTDLENWLEQLYRKEQSDRRVRFVAENLQKGETGIGRLADMTGLSHKHLVYEFERRIGLKPKLFARIQRLQRTIGWIGVRKHVDWADAVSIGGFYDQAHLINEFRELIGLSPTEYLARRSPYQGYLNVA